MKDVSKPMNVMPDPLMDELDPLLRAGRPKVVVPGGLDARIQRALAESRPRRSSPMRWLAAAAVLVLGGVIVGNLADSGEKPEATVVVVTPEVEVPVPVVENPLRREALALKRDADRTGRFLIGVLPSLGFAE